MNTPNPLMPQGSLPQFQSSGKSTVRIAVFTIVAIHAVFFSGLLMQGCNKRDPSSAANKSLEPTNLVSELPKVSNELYYSGVHELPSVPGNAAPTNTEVASQPANTQPSASVTPQNTLPIITPPQVASTTPAAPKPSTGSTEPAADAKEYTIVRGDNFSKIAKANHITVAALKKANPNVDPEKIQPGHKLQIPPEPAPGSQASGEKPAAKVADSKPSSASTDSNGSSHVVKPGDNLTKIAKQHRTTISAIKAANPKLKTNRLLVGDKIKLPASVSVPSPLTSTNPDQVLPEGARGTALR